MLTVQQRDDLRRRVLAGEQLSIEEMRAAVKTLRGSRPIAQATSAAKKATKGSGKVMSDDELDASLGDLGL